MRCRLAAQERIQNLYPCIQGETKKDARTGPWQQMENSGSRPHGRAKKALGRSTHETGVSRTERGPKTELQGELAQAGTGSFIDAGGGVPDARRHVGLRGRGRGASAPSVLEYHVQYRGGTRRRPRGLHCSTSECPRHWRKGRECARTRTGAGAGAGAVQKHTGAAAAAATSRGEYCTLRSMIARL